MPAGSMLVVTVRWHAYSLMAEHDVAAYSWFKKTLARGVTPSTKAVAVCIGAWSSEIMHTDHLTCSGITRGRKLPLVETSGQHDTAGAV
jgi:hypothetical protein